MIITTRILAAACALLLSSACVLSAVGPAQSPATTAAPLTA